MLTIAGGGHDALSRSTMRMAARSGPIKQATEGCNTIGETLRVQGMQGTSRGIAAVLSEVAKCSSQRIGRVTPQAAHLLADISDYPSEAQPVLLLRGGAGMEV